MTRDPNHALVSLGEISPEELRLVHGALQLLMGESGSTDGPLIRSEGGRRVWQILGHDSIVNVYGDDCLFEGTYFVGRQFIFNCMALMRVDDSIRLSILDYEITASSPAGTVNMMCVPVSRGFKSVNQIETVQARLSHRHLFRAMETATNLPVDIPNHVIRRNDDPPITLLSITENQMTCQTNWTQFGSTGVSTTAPATTRGLGSIAISAQLLNRMVNVIGLSGNPEFTITFDPLGGDHIEFASRNLFIALRRTPVGADAVHQQVSAALKDSKIHHVVSERGTVAVMFCDQTIRVSILESDETKTCIIRITHTLLRDANETLALLKEINMCNKMLVRSRLWIDADRVIIGCDLEESDMPQFISHLASLLNDAHKLDGILGPLCVDAQ
jgi:hypothetical protein